MEFGSRDSYELVTRHRPLSPTNYTVASSCFAAVAIFAAFTGTAVSRLVEIAKGAFLGTSNALVPQYVVYVRCDLTWMPLFYRARRRIL